MSFLPTAHMRVERQTSQEANADIHRTTNDNIKYYGSLPAGQIRDRLRELEYEWDIEKVLQANSGITILLGLALARLDRRWLFLSGISAAFLSQHAVQGWCPPVMFWRRYGIRTNHEIGLERRALIEALERNSDPQVVSWEH